MAVWSIVKYSELFGFTRLDAEFYKPLNRTNDTLLEAFPDLTTLGEISKVFRKGIFDIKADNYCDEGIPFVRVSNLKNALIADSDIAFIPEDLNNKYKSTSLEKWDIVLSKTAYPAASIVQLDKCNTSQDTIAIKTKFDKVLNTYVVLYLNTNIGLSQMKRILQGNVQMHLSLPDAKTLKIPLPEREFQKKVFDLFSSYIELLNSSRSLLASAEGMLLAELGLGKLELPKAKWNVRNFSETRTEERIDGEYYLPKYYAIFDVLRKKGCSKLNEIAKVPIKRHFKAENGELCKYIEISDIDVSNGSSEYTERPFEELPANAKIKFKGGELIISKVRPTRGAISVLPVLGNKAVCSGAFTMAEIDSPLREVVMVWLRSEYGKMLLERPCTGGQYPTITDNDVANVLIPNISENIATTISDKVKKSHSARAEAKRLLEEAKRKVEEMILEG